MTAVGHNSARTEIVCETFSNSRAKGKMSQDSMTEDNIGKMTGSSMSDGAAKSSNGGEAGSAGK
jgi:hypothetical protein